MPASERAEENHVPHRCLTKELCQEAEPAVSGFLPLGLRGCWMGADLDEVRPIAKVSAWGHADKLGNVPPSVAGRSIWIIVVWIDCKGAGPNQPRQPGRDIRSPFTWLRDGHSSP